MSSESLQRLAANGRSADQDFAPEEELYRRIMSEHFVEGCLVAMSIDFPECSVVRQKYTESPHDTLLQDFPKYLKYGCVKWTVSEIPPSLEMTVDNKELVSHFRVEHVPDDDFFPHSEVRAYKNNKYDKPRKPAKTIDKIIRQILADRAKLEIDPKI